MKNKNSRQFGYFIAITSAVIYGLMPLITKTVYESGANSITAAFFRMSVGCAVFLVFHLLTEGGPLGVSKKELKKLCIFAVGYGATPVLLYTSYNYLASGVAAAFYTIYMEASGLLEMKPYHLAFWSHLLAMAVVTVCAYPAEIQLPGHRFRLVIRPFAGSHDSGRQFSLPGVRKAYRGAGYRASFHL